MNKLSNHGDYLRPLNPMEQAFAITNRHFPLCVTIVLKLENGPSSERIRQSLDALQARHTMLNAGIYHEKGGWHFFLHDEPEPIPLTIVERKSDKDWMGEAEAALNRPIAMEGPLMQVVYLAPDGKDDAAECLLSFHHSFVDSSPLRLILHELLSLCGGLPLPERAAAPEGVHGAREPVYKLPVAFRGPRLPGRMLPFIARQMAEELRFFRLGKGRPVPADSHNAIVNLQLSEPDSTKLMDAARRHNVGLNSVLNAAILLAHIRNNYQGELASEFRTIVFADLRPYMQPQPPESYFGCFVSMLRFSLMVDADTTAMSLAKELDKQVGRAQQRGDLQLFSLISKHLVSLSMATKKLRLSNTALSFMGYLDLQPAYGPMRLRDVHAYITNNKLGAEFSGFGKLLFGQIELDFTYLTAEMEHSEAALLVRDIEQILQKLINLNE